MSIEQTERLRNRLQASLDELVARIGKIQIGTKEQFPFGWRKAAKGRTVWRILEELITQNIERYITELGISKLTVSHSEISVYDFHVIFEDDEVPIYVNVKSALLDGKIQKDDISKGVGLQAFYEADINREFFIATFFIKFNEDMTIEIDKCTAFPITWIPDVYVNPSNNGNLQSSKYKNLDDAVRRTSAEFFEVFKNAMHEAARKKMIKLNS